MNSLDNEVEVTLLPCGHYVSCVNCADRLKHCVQSVENL